MATQKRVEHSGGKCPFMDEVVISLSTVRSPFFRPYLGYFNCCCHLFPLHCYPMEFFTLWKMPKISIFYIKNQDLWWKSKPKMEKCHIFLGKKHICLIKIQNVNCEVSILQTLFCHLFPLHCDPMEFFTFHFLENSQIFYF